jgi:hypothetical protein
VAGRPVTDEDRRRALLNALRRGRLRITKGQARHIRELVWNREMRRNQEQAERRSS